MPDGTQNADNFNAPAGNSSFNGLGGTDTIVFNFALTSATFTWIGNQVIVDTATSHTVLTGFEIYKFTDGTVNNDDGSPLIDDLYYNATYHDVWSAHLDPDAHYNSTGWHENHNPNAFFNTRLYLSANPDVAAAGVNPLLHFDSSGWKEGRAPSTSFDVGSYLLANPDVAAAHVDPLAHFLQFGAQEGRQPFATTTTLATANGFDYIYYLQHNPDVLASGVDAFQHFQTFGWKEGRNPNAFFDVTGYLQTYPDVAAAHINPLDHYHQSGYKEGRNPSPLFDTAAYLAANPDVAAAHVDPLQHYLQFGIKEGRVAIPTAVADTNATSNSVAEGAANGAATGLTVSWGGWVSPSLSYALTGDTSGGGFAINPTTGVVTVLDGSKLDFETAPGHAYSITVQATDAGQTKSQVFVIAVADQAPTVPLDPGATPLVTEGVANGVAVGIDVASTDVNGGAITFSLSNNAGGRFQIDSTTGVVTTGPNANLINFEDNVSHSYTITVVASDGTLSTSTDFTILVGDVAPTQPTDGDGTTNTVQEGATTGAVVGVTAASTDVNGGALTYSFAPGGDAGGLFQINSTTGVISVSAFGAANIDYESAPGHAYSVTVQATDGALTSTTQTFSIALTNANPSTPADSDGATGGAILEGSATGTAVGVTASSADPAGTTVVYSLTDSAGGRFQIDSSTGTVTTGPNANLIDFETQPVGGYNITVLASDGQGGTASQSFTIAVTNANPSTPVDTNGGADTVAEGVGSNQPTGLTVQATDPGGPAVVYSLTDDAGGRFQINSTTGVVTTGPNANLIDFESSGGSYNVTAQASDGNGGTSSFTFAIGVADVAPGNWSDANAAANSVVEGDATDTAVGVHADAIDPNGGTVVYSFANSTDSAGGRFQIDSTTGIITVGPNANLIDFESSGGSYNVTVTASTVGGTATSTQGFTINVQDVAPTAPVDNTAPTGGSIQEGAANGATVGITAHSDDVNGGTVAYSLTNDAGGLFTINSSTGVVTVTAAGATGIDFESSGGVYAIQVQASDGTLTSTTDFTVAVTNAAPSTPVDTDGPATKSANDQVQRTAGANATVGIDLSSIDPNGGAVSFSLTDDTGTAADAGGVFSIDAAGVVHVANAAAIAASNSGDTFTIQARAFDGTAFSAAAQFTITVVDNVLTLDLNGTNGGGLGYAATYTENQSGVAVADSDDVITNPGNPGADTIVSAAIVLTDAQAGDSLSVNGALPGGITANTTAGAGIITVTLSGSSTFANYATAIRQIEFSTSGDAPNTADRHVDVTINDGSVTSTATTTITVESVNDTPVLALGAAGAISYSENADPTAFFATGSVSDPDAPANFNGGSYTVEITANSDFGDEIVLLGSSGFSVSGTSILFAGQTIGTIHSGTDLGTDKVTIDFTQFATPAVVDQLADAFGFRSSSENPSSLARTVSFTFNDGGHTGSGTALDSNVVTKTVNVTAINDAPVNHVPAVPQTVAAGADLAFGFLDVQFSDKDLNGGDVTVTLSVGSGAIEVTAPTSPSAGFLITTNNTDTVVVTGNLADVNDTLGTIVYHASATPGTVTLTVTTDDGGNSGTGGNQQDIDAITIVVTSPGTGDPALDLDGDDSTSTGANFTTSFTEGGAAIAIADTDVAILETTPGTLTSATVTLVNHQAGDTLAVNISGTLPPGITASSYNAGTGVLTLTSSTTNTPAEYEAALKLIEFSTAGGSPNTADRVITVVVNDGTTDSNTAVTTVTINAVNDAPVLDLDTNVSSADYTTTYGIGGAPAAVASATVSITDVDDANVDSATVDLTTGHASDILAIAGVLPAGISASIDTATAGHIVVHMTGSASKAAYQAALQQIVFTTADPSLTPAPRSVTVVVDDGNPLSHESNVAITTINVTPNPAPAAGDDTDLAIETGGLNNGTAGQDPTGNVITGVGTDANAAGADSDANGPQSGISVIAVSKGTETTPGAAGTVGAPLTGDYGVLTLNSDGSYTYQVNNANAAVQALRTSGQQLFDRFTYTVKDSAGASDTNSDGGGQTNSIATLTITINGANDNPVGVVDTASATEKGGVPGNGGSGGTDPSGNVLTNDTDVDSVANGETKTVIGAALGSVAGPLNTGVNTGLHGAGASDFGTFTVQSDGSYTYAVNQTSAAVQALRTSAQTLTDTFSYTVRDAAGATSTTQVTVMIHGQNDNPVANDDQATVQEAGGTANGTAGSPSSISNFNVLTGVGTGSIADTDVDSTANGETQQIQGVTFGNQGNTVLSTGVASGITNTGVGLDYGTLTLNANGTYSYVVNQSNATVQALNNGQSVDDVFTYTMRDAAGATDNATITIHVTGKNDAPVAAADGSSGTPFTTVLQNRATSVSTVNLLTNDSDVDSASANLTAVKDTNTAHGGTVTVNANGTFSVTYAAGSNYLGLDTFTYHTNDNDPTAPLSSASVTVTIDVQPKIWFINKDSASATEDGSLANPFKSIAAFNAANAAASDKPDIVYLQYGNAGGTGVYSSTDGINLANGQTLLGSGVDLTYTTSASAPNPSQTITLLDVDNTKVSTIQITGGAGNQAVQLAQNNTLRGFNIDTTNADGIGIEDSNGAGAAGSVGTLTVSGVAINGVGKAIDIDQGGTLAASFSGITSTGSNSEGIQFGGIAGSLLGGSFVVTGTTAITNADTNAIQVSTTAANASFSFGTATTITDNAIGSGHNGNGIDLTAAIGAANSFNFGNLSVTTDAGFGLKAVSAGTLTFGAGTNSIVANGDAAIDLTSTSLSNATFTTVTSTGGTAGINIVTPGTGAFTANGGTLSGHSTAEINLSGGAADFTYAGTVGNGSGLSVQIASKTAGTTTISGNINDTNDAGGGIVVSSVTGGTISFSGATKTLNTGASTAVNLTTNTGATINFTGGGLDIDTTSGTGFNATGGGTVNVTGSANHLTSTTGTAINFNNTNIGSSNVTFQDISANGGANGIVLNTTGTAGGLVVTGTGTTDGSGGTIQNTTNRGASFINSNNISLSNMTFTNAGTTDLDADNSGLSTGDNLATNAAIHLQNVTTVTLTNVDITGGAEQGINGNTVANFNLINSTITNAGNAADEDNIHFFNMSGASSIVNTTLTHTSGGGDDNFNLQTTSGNLDLLISGGSAIGTAGGVNQQGSGYLFGIRGTSVANISLEGVSSTNNFSGGIVADAFDSAIMNLRVLNSTSTGNNDQLSVSAGDSSKVDLEATGNTLRSLATGDFVVVSLLGSALDTGYVFDARISNNTISVADELAADGVFVFNAGGGVINTAITNNNISYAGGQRAIIVQQGQDGAATTHATITGNIIDLLLNGGNNADNAIVGTSGVADPSGAGSFLDLNIGGAGALANTITHSLGGTVGAGGDIRVRQRFADNVNLDGYAGGTNDTAAVINYLNSRNNEVDSSTASVDGGSYSGNAIPAFISVSVSAASVLEDGATNLVYTFTRTGSTAAGLVANFAITGTATAGTDFAVAGATTFNNGSGLGTVTFAAGSATAQITVDPTADSDSSEFDESVVVDVDSGSFARAFIADDLPLMAAQGQGTAGAPTLTSDALAPIVAEAINRWAAAGVTAEQLDLLKNVHAGVADLPNGILGDTSGSGIKVDINGAGWGWFVDATPSTDSEFAFASSPNLGTAASGLAAGQIDLLSVIMHEIGHALGLAHAPATDEVMSASLETGTRRLPSAADVAATNNNDAVEFGGAQVYAVAAQASHDTTGGFDAQYYLVHNPDVAAAGVDPLAHFETFGWQEGRNPNAHFDTAGYLAHYADVAAAHINPLLHYAQFGWQEGRDPSPGFDTLGYLAANPDVATAHINPLVHYLQFGIVEGRAPINDGLWHG